MGASGGRTTAVCIARAWLEDAKCGLAPAGFGAGEAPHPILPPKAGRGSADASGIIRQAEQLRVMT